MKRFGSAWTLLLLALGAAAWVGCAGSRPQAGKGAGDLHGAQKMRMAQSLMRGGQVGEALSTAEEAVSEEPDNAGLRQFFGEICFAAGLLPEAEKAFRDALRLDPYLTAAHTHLGAVYQEMSRLDDAEREYMEVLKNPAYPQPEAAYLGLGLVYAKQNRIDDAIAQLRQSVGLNPKYYPAHYELAGVLEQDGRLGEAVAEYEVAEPGYRGSAEFQYRLGFAYMRSGDETKARDRLRRVLDMAPGSPSAEQARELLKVLE